MSNFDYSAIGQRIKALRKNKGLNQQELADLLGKSLRTVQKYETGEIEVSIATVNQLADLLDSTPTFLLGYEANPAPISNLSDIISFLFHLEQIAGVDFDIRVKRPPHNDEWSCALVFDGKSKEEYNSDLCLFLESWQDERENVRTYGRSQSSYKRWKEQTLAYYAGLELKHIEPEELSSDEMIQKRNAYLKSLMKDKEEE